MSSMMAGTPGALAPVASMNAYYPGEQQLGSAHYGTSLLPQFFGPPKRHVAPDANERLSHEAYFLPDAYCGRNDYIRDTVRVCSVRGGTLADAVAQIVQLVVNYNSFVTSEVLPWREQNNPNIAWESIRFDRTLADLEPEQGVPRYVTVEKEAHSDHMVRRGLALIVNHGFAATEGGARDFMYKVATIAGAVQETADQAGIMALLEAKAQYKQLAADSMRHATTAVDVFRHEIWQFGIVQHTERGWYHIDAEAQHAMRGENVQPDTWIVPPRMTSFAALGQKAETEVYRAGETVARANLRLGEDNFATFRGKSVYEVRPYKLDVDGRTIDPLNRTKMIGDFFVVPCCGARPSEGGPSGIDLEPFAGKTQVYCCETDRFETFAWKDVAADSGFFPAGGGTDEEIDAALDRLYGGKEHWQRVQSDGGEFTIDEAQAIFEREHGDRCGWQGLQEAIDESSGTGSPITDPQQIRIARSAMDYLIDVVTAMDLAGTIADDRIAAAKELLRPVVDRVLKLPSSMCYDMLCFRPFRQYTMGTGILCKKGSELGNTFRGWADFQLTDNIIAKTHIGHFTFWHASVVTNPKCLFLAEDIFCTNYEGGEGRVVYTGVRALEDKFVCAEHDEDAFCQDPLGEMHSSGGASVIAFPVPMGAVDPLDRRLQTNNPIDLTGSLDPLRSEHVGHTRASEVHIGDYAKPGTSSRAQAAIGTVHNHLVRHMEAGLETFAVNGEQMSAALNSVFKFHKMNHKVDYAASRTFINGGNLVNTVCFHTMQKFENPRTGRWEVSNLNTGHFGEDGIYEGGKRIRCGFIGYHKEMDYAKQMSAVGVY